MRRRGFTLIEVLVTLVVVTLFSAAVYSMFIQSVVDSKSIEQKTLSWRLGQSILRLMERDLTSCPAVDAQAPHFQGSLDFNESARLDLVSAVDSLQPAENGRAADLVSLSYQVAQSEEEEGEEGLSLYRIEDDGAAEREPSRRLLARGVKSFTLEYYDGSGWATVWERPELPLAVRVDLVLNRKIQETVTGPAREVELPFRSVVVIPAGE